jgi:hypothetical protein
MKCNKCNQIIYSLNHHSNWNSQIKQHVSTSKQCGIVKFHCNACCSDDLRKE